jgi:hypothetical protein
MMSWKEAEKLKSWRAGKEHAVSLQLFSFPALQR